MLQYYLEKQISHLNSVIINNIKMKRNDDWDGVLGHQCQDVIIDTGRRQHQSRVCNMVCGTGVS